METLTTLSASLADGTAATPEAAGAAAVSGWLGVIGLAAALLAPLVLWVLWRGDVIRPGSLRRRGARDPSGLPWWLWLLYGFMVMMASGIGAGFAMSVGAALLEDPPRVLELAIMSAGGSVFGIAAALLLLWLAAQQARSTPRAGLSLRVKWSDGAVGLLAMALTFPIVNAVSIVSMYTYQLVMGRPPAVLAHETLEVLHAEPGNPAVWMLIASAVVAAPIIEEIAFRVFLQSALVRLFGRIWPAIIVTSTLFALVHLAGGVDAENWHSLPVLFTLGAAMGVAYEWTRRPAVPIVMHMVFNAYNVSLVVFGAV